VYHLLFQQNLVVFHNVYVVVDIFLDVHFHHLNLQLHQLNDFLQVLDLNDVLLLMNLIFSFFSLQLLLHF
jgi:hypothetical protein